ncbi:MAG: hypothetical protein R2879_09290 [Saprospiraceae bacterium]
MISGVFNGWLFLKMVKRLLLWQCRTQDSLCCLFRIWKLVPEIPLKTRRRVIFPSFLIKLEIIAGEKTDPATGTLYLDIFKNDSWETIQQYEWSAERFLRPGLQSILSVNDDGTEVFYRQFGSRQDAIKGL